MTKAKTKAKPKSIFELYAKDPERMEDGVWTEMDNGGVLVKIRSTNSDYYLETVQRLQEEVRDRTKGRNGKKPKKLSEDEQKEILVRSVCEGVIADWDGVYDQNGELIPFTPKGALKLLNIKDIRVMGDFLDEIFQKAQRAEIFKQELFEDEAKNLEKSSDGP